MLVLTKVDVQSYAGESISFPLQNVADGFILKEVRGLDPGKASLVSSTFANMDGAQYQAARFEPRNIVMLFDLEPRYSGTSVRELRNTLYRHFMPKTPLTLGFEMDDGLAVEIEGIVEAAESPIFSSDPQFAVSVICHRPDFVDPAIKFGTGEAHPQMTYKTIEYEGSVPAGIKFILSMNAGNASNGIILQHESPTGVVSPLTFSAALQGLDEVSINTTPGEKSAILKRAGVESSILYGVSPQSKWFQLEPGTNKIGIQVTGSQTYWEYEWYNRYGGL